MNHLIVHVSETAILPEGGMGRVEYYWKQAFERAGYQFIHIGPKEVGEISHPGLFPGKAYHYFKKLQLKPAAFIVHEPASGFFVNKGVPCFVESHGIERRYWELQLKGHLPQGEQPISLKTKILFPLWRLRNCDNGLKKADKLLLINSEDKSFAMNRYKRTASDIYMFENGVSPDRHLSSADTDNKIFTVLFNGSWIERKGIDTLIKAAEALFKKGLTIHYLLIGTGKSAVQVTQSWPEYLRDRVEIVSTFKQEQEADYLAKASIFVLPSYFEGQPLSLLQAMQAGKCCLTTSTCGQKDIIQDGKNGFLFDTGDAVKLASLIHKCYENKTLASTIGKRAQQDMKIRNWQMVSDKVVKFVTENII